MDWTTPPRTREELPLWRCFAVTVELEVWEVVRRWVVKFGNPFVIPEHAESYEQWTERQLFQEAIMYTYQK